MLLEFWLRFFIVGAGFLRAEIARREFAAGPGSTKGNAQLFVDAVATRKSLSTGDDSDVRLANGLPTATIAPKADAAPQLPDVTLTGADGGSDYSTPAGAAGTDSDVVLTGDSGVGAETLTEFNPPPTM